MKVITLLNEKGGVCKSTMSIHISAGLAMRGKRVVLIDTDPQGIIGYYFGMIPDDNYYRLLAKGAEWEGSLLTLTPEIYESPKSPSKGEFIVLTGNKETRNIAFDVNDAMVLKKRIAELEGFADVIIIDTAPTPSLAMTLVYAATDAIIYPTELSRLSLQSLLNSLESREGMLIGLDTSIDVLGIIPTKTRLRTIEHEENLKLLRGNYGDLVWPNTSLSIVWDEAAGQTRTVFAYDNESTAAKQMWAIVDRAEHELEKLEYGTR